MPGHEVATLIDLGLKPVLATELEFYLVEYDGQQFQPQVPRVPGSDIRQPGMQYEVMEDLYEVDDPVLACDHAVLLKRAVKAAARKHGMAATFMAKPFADIAGSGMHVHVSLLDENGQNVFAGKSADGDFSDMLRHAICGLGEAMSECIALFAPNANSYRRHAPGNFVAASPEWGPNHRGVALRIPLSGPRNRRLEHRVAGADANPYFVVAAIMAGIHHGISNQCEPRPMTPEG